ncbi:hypothetical protein HU200_016901 [Digitaria exilis]|uniref:DUF1618 domain-containing protein n=1 Tax=Digitaria exilis TaxID=1010633 RepID=A0A835KIJ0_9POAL|nr:hypothetical protein HU200_016901 [Digitaria exilis]
MQQCHLDEHRTGLLRRSGEDGEFAVAELKIVEAASEDTPKKKQMVAELLLFRHGRWSVERPKTINGEGENAAADLLSSWTTRTVLPVGDTDLCWVDLYRGLLLCRVFDRCPVLRHVPLPVETMEMEPLTGPGSARNVCVSGGGHMVKLVVVFPRNGASSSKEGYTDLIPSLLMDAVDEARKNDAGNSAPSSRKSLPEPGMQASDILAGFQEVPSYGLDRDDMLKAYNILGLDNGRRISCLLGLPKNMRKDWLLMEIKSMIA